MIINMYIHNIYWYDDILQDIAPVQALTLTISSVHRIQQCASVDTAASNADKHHCSVQVHTPAILYTLHTAGTMCNTVHSVQCTGSNTGTSNTAHCCNTVHTGASNRIQHWCKQHWAPTLTSKSNKCRVGRYGCGGPTPIYWTWYIFHYMYILGPITYVYILGPIMAAVQYIGP